MRFLHENWWKILLGGLELFVLLKFLDWHFNAEPKNLRKSKGEVGKEDDWQSTIVDK